MITDLPTKRILKRYDSDRHFSEFYPQDGGGENQLEPDMERDYATVAVRIPAVSTHPPPVSLRPDTAVKTRANVASARVGAIDRFPIARRCEAI